ncbi:hypothetical protein GYMLUDRAFT_616768 [Collybiopsis luxurians FD-317 M1]|uniref:Uncharacterized protein n=1 Tax=Collybiopsis luxurians FD-317 M1 TaxID=944289 RepID=A0A0D0CVG8_9AGAR|nr:hypothetical protein GYMLUDRAFT_616768 [Collybiopsis luxurians FD-317 M1]
MSEAEALRGIQYAGFTRGKFENELDPLVDLKGFGDALGWIKYAFPDFLLSGMNADSKPIITFYNRPGLFMSKKAQRAFITELRSVAVAALRLDNDFLTPNYVSLSVIQPLYPTS